MADSGKAKTPGSVAKKAQEGGGKKRRKHKKSTEAAGDGAPSPSPASVPSNHSQASASSSQIKPEGATAVLKGGNEKKDSEPLGKGIVNHDDNEIKASEPIGKFSPNNAEKVRNTSDTKVKSTPVTGNRDKKDSVPLEKGTPKEDVSKLNESAQQNTPQQEGKEKKDGDVSRKGTPKQTGKDKTDGQPAATGIQMQSAKEKKGSETPGRGGAQQKSNFHEKPETHQKDKAESEKVPDSVDVQQKSKVKAKAEVVKKIEVVIGENKPKTKAEPGKKPEVVDGEQKSKAQQRAERRAIQEAQRAAKDSKKNVVASGSSTGAANSTSAAPVKKEPVGDKSKPAGEVGGGEKNSKKKPAVNAVIQNETEEQMWARKEKEMLGKSLKIDNSILNLGFQYFHHNIVGANARCMALLATLKEVITKYRTPDEKELSRDLEKNFLNPCISYLNYCRPISTSMGNAIKHLKHHISKIPRDMEDEAAISKLRDEIDNFIQVNIIKAAEAVAHYADTKIDNGDVILVYAASSLIGQVLKTAYKGGKTFRVIVVEGRPRSEGKSMLRYLVRCGIPCSYIYIGSASHAMSEATKVFLGAAAMFAIGDMYSRSGNSMIAALAKANNIPVLVCCETYKFTDKVQLHTGDSNLHTRGKDLVSIGHKTPILANWEEAGLGLLNLMYDVTGSEYITAVVTELGMLPCTSVPVVLRRQEDLY